MPKMNASQKANLSALPNPMCALIVTYRTGPKRVLTVSMTHGERYGDVFTKMHGPRVQSTLHDPSCNQH